MDYNQKIKIKMSAINSSLPCNSQEFQLLQPEPIAKEHSDEVFISLNEWSKVDPSENLHTLSQQDDMTIGIVIDEETFIVLDKKESLHEFTQQDWQQLIQRKQKEVAALVKQQERGGPECKSRLTLRQRNAVLSLKSSDCTGRMRLWEIANHSIGVCEEFITKEKSAQQSRHEILTILSYQLAESEVRSLKQNVLKMHKIVKAIGAQRGSNCDALRVHQHEKEIMQWIYDSLIRYAIEDQQVRYCKGLEYICLGIVVAYPHVDLPKYSQLLHHFLYHNGFRELYQEGSPRFFRELQRIRQALRQDAPQLYDKIEDSEGEFKNLFVTYFRSCLIYKVSNPDIIRKMFQLLFVEGIQGMKAILIRILTVHSEVFMEKPNFLQHLCSQIVLSYFQGKSNQAAIQQRFQKLFLI